MDAPDGSPGKAVHQIRSIRKRGDHLPALRPVRKPDSFGGVVRVLCHDHSMSGAGRIHPLIIKNDLHPQRIRAFHDEADRLKPGIRQIRDILRDPDSRMQHDGVHPLCLYVLQLFCNLLLIRPVIQKPERNGGEFFRRVRKRPKQFFSSFFLCHSSSLSAAGHVSPFSFAVRRCSLSADMFYSSPICSVCREKM